jgi:hypothetical protein
MFIATLLKPRLRAITNINAGGSSPARQSKMLQRRRRPLNSSLPATQHIDADFMMDDDTFPVAPAFDSIDVVGVAPEPSQSETTQPADIAPTVVAVALADAVSVDFIHAVPGMTPLFADAAPNESALALTPVEDIAAMLSATNAAIEPEVQLVPEIITVAPVIVAIAPAETMPADAVPAKEKKAKKWGKKTENVGLGGGAVKAKNPRSKSAKISDEVDTS